MCFDLFGVWIADELKNFFSKYGKVVEHEIIRDHTTKRSRGFGFIVFDSEKVVDNILADGNMIDMGGTQVSCVWYFRMFDVFETGNANYKGAVCFKDDGFGSERILLCHNVMQECIFLLVNYCYCWTLECRFIISPRKPGKIKLCL